MRSVWTVDRSNCESVTIFWRFEASVLKIGIGFFMDYDDRLDDWPGAFPTQ